MQQIKSVKRPGVMIFFTCPYADLRLIAENTKACGGYGSEYGFSETGQRMGAVLPESLVEAGAKTVVLNHAENQKNIGRALWPVSQSKGTGLITIVGADSTTGRRQWRSLVRT